MNTLPARALTIDRLSYNPDGTPGTMKIGPHLLSTLELPISRDNDAAGCLLPGTYTLEYTTDPKRGGAYRRANGADRSTPVFRIGNYAGDVTLDFVSDITSGILIGRSAVLLNHNHVSQRAVVLSASCYASLITACAPAPILLTINPPRSEQNVIYPPTLHQRRT